MNEFESITKLIVNFRDQRDWEKFHNAKDLALAISIEAAELNELFLWKNAEDANIDKIKEELADILNYAFLLAYKCNLDIPEIMTQKLILNEQKYPADRVKGSSKKYDEL